MAGTPSAAGVQLERNPYAPDAWDVDFDGGVRILPSSGRRQQVAGSGNVIPANLSEDSDVVVFDRVHRGRMGAPTNAGAALTRRISVGEGRPICILRASSRHRGSSAPALNSRSLFVVQAAVGVNVIAVHFVTRPALRRSLPSRQTSCFKPQHVDSIPFRITNSPAPSSKLGRQFEWNQSPTLTRRVSSSKSSDLVTQESTACERHYQTCTGRVFKVPPAQAQGASAGR